MGVGRSRSVRGRVGVALAIGLLLSLPVHAAKRGTPRLEARATRVASATGPEVRVELQLRNVGSGTLRGCVGRAWGWRFPTSDNAESRVLAPPRDLDFSIEPGKVFRWNERLTYAGPQAWIEAVAFWVELVGPDCKDAPTLRLESSPVMLESEDSVPD